MEQEHDGNPPPEKKLWRTRALLASGMTRAGIDKAVAEGTMFRLCHGV
ncbi:type IV toxin-antitoxin system AbiEi family antitoxin domain-containing protein [Corynebacterium variabile]|nr:type IV toxin-antitoxin system AbiEi family antitoxin domain-containing protein [Corynebacterium variabile]MDN6477453.1 type IV toxin-antitoxin system AbiEi family antitoxin domain-containing protein [Corynebacterium variabile]MDN6676172.1 type IV toxin-antitoxin system AbiEi family antitoxin domain-containing protein [Corynebacterium variabile]MDN6814348.1 type IV toxin-antitoxin system AbiEi family antitoxin domain-containing protein [Corynebacterium variabile]